MEAQPQRCAGFSAVFNPVSQYAVCYPQRGGESQQRHHRACPPALPCAHHPTMPSVPQLGHQRVFQEEDQINSQKRPKVPKNQSARKLQIVCNQKVRKVMFAPPFSPPIRPFTTLSPLDIRLFTAFGVLHRDLQFWLLLKEIQHQIQR